MQVTNQKPVVLSPVYTPPVKGDFKPDEYIKKTLAAPLYTPLTPSQPVTITSQNNTYTEDDITQYLMDCCDENINTVAETFIKTLFGKALVYFDANTNLLIQDTFGIQAAVKEKLPAPSARVIYTPNDVKMASKQFLGGQISPENLFANLMFYARPQTLGFYFATNLCFDNFKLWLQTQLQPLLSNLPQNTINLFAEFQKLKLNDLTESLILRDSETDNNEEYSFARMLLRYLMDYTNNITPDEYGILPFHLTNLFCPKTVVFVNLEKHARATNQQIKDEWEIINKSLALPVATISNNALNKLTAVQKSLQKIATTINVISNGQKAAQARIARAKFRKTEPNMINMLPLIKKVMTKMKAVAKSENSYKSVKMTYARPNRRNPDDFNKQGKMVSTKYLPDLHIYLDTSGSVTEINYQEAIKALIKLAHKLNINMYFNSFSDSLSQCTKLNIKNKSPRKIYAEFQRIPKVYGGTNFEQIWHYINESPKRQKELSLLITDFGWTANNYYVKHPENLYYMPLSKMDWSSICYCANHFMDSMQHNDPMIRRRLLF